MTDPLRPQESRGAAALPAFAPARKPATGELFAEEVERAAERARGGPGNEERAAELASEKRAARRATFGRDRERAPQSDAEASEAVFRPGDAPVQARPAAAPPREAVGSSAPEATAADAPHPAGAGAQPATEPVAAPAADPSVSAGAVVPTAMQAANAAAPAVLDAVAPAAARPADGASLQTAPGLRAQPGPGRAEAAPAPPPAAADPAVLERAQEILRQIRLHLAPGVRRLTLDLEPVELGRMAIQLALRNGKVHGIVRAERAETLELLRAQAPELVALLAERGIDAESVRFELGFGGAGARAGGERSAGSGGPAPRSAAAAARALDLPPDGPPRRSSGLVDLYA